MTSLDLTTLTTEQKTLWQKLTSYQIPSRHFVSYRFTPALSLPPNFVKKKFLHVGKILKLILYSLHNA